MKRYGVLNSNVAMGITATRVRAYRSRARRIAAGLFCLFLLADWAAHGAMPHEIFFHELASNSSGQEADHEHCGYFCRGEGHDDGQSPNANSHSFQHMGVLEIASNVAAIEEKHSVAKIESSSDIVISRSLSPPSPPPKIS